MEIQKDFLKKEQAFFWGVPALLWQFLFFYIPLGFLVSTSFIQYSTEVRGNVFSLDHYALLLSPVYFNVIARSILMASGTVFVCLLIGYPVAYYLAVKKREWSTLFFALLVLPFWTNFLLLVYAWYFLLENEGLINNALMFFGIVQQPLALMYSNFAVFCGMLYCYLPFMLLPLYSNLEKLDVRLL